MAKLLTTKPDNLTLYPNSFERQEATPLDASSLFFNLNDAKEYAANNPVAYVGQIIVAFNEENIPVPYIIKNVDGELTQIGQIKYDFIDGGTSEGVNDSNSTPIQTSTISDILNGSYTSSGVTNEHAVNHNVITEIVNGTFSGPEMSGNDISNEIIEDIVDGGLDK